MALEDENEVLGTPKKAENIIPAQPSSLTSVDPRITDIPSQGAGNVIDQSMQAQQQQIMQPDPAAQAYIDAQKAALMQPTEIGPQGIQALMPGLQHNINVGSTSGSLIGSGNIYVPGGNIYPWDVELAKRQQQEMADIAAEQEKAKIGKDFKFRQAPELTDKYFQQSLNRQFDEVNNKFMQDIYDVYGEDYRYVMDNPQMFKEGREYLQKMDALEVMAGEANQMTELVGSMQDALAAGEKIYSDETLDVLQRYENMMGEFETGDVSALVGLRDVMKDLQGGKAVDDYLNSKDVIGSIQGEILGGTSIGSSGFQGYAKLSTSDKEIFDKNIENLVDVWTARNGEFRDEFKAGLVSKESLTKHLKGYLQNKVKRTADIKSTTSGGGKKITKNKVSELIGSGDMQSFTSTEGNVYAIQSDKQLKMPTVNHKVSMAGLNVLTPNMDPNVQNVQDVQIVSLERASDQQPGGGFTGVNPGDIYAVGVYEQQVPEVDEYGDETGKMVTKEVSVPILVDDAFIDAMETDAGKLLLEEDVFTKAVNEMKGDEATPKFN